MEYAEAMKILVFGAGVLGSLYAAKLSEAGHDVAVLARGKRLNDIRAHGLVLEDVQTKRRTVVTARVVDLLDPEDRYDLVLVVVRQEQLPGVLPALAASRSTPCVLFFGNNASRSQELTDALGPDRVVLGFPGASGTIGSDSTVRYLLIKQQSTTIGELSGEHTPRLEEIAGPLRQSGFPTAVSAHMDSWLTTHALFVTAIATAIYVAGGTTHRLAARPATLRLMVRATKQGFRALRALRAFDAPTNLRVLYNWMPTWFAVRYWHRVLPTELSELTFAAHANRAREEMTLLADELLVLLRSGHVPVPAVEELFRQAGIGTSQPPADAPSSV